MIFIWNSKVFIQENAFENIFDKKYPHRGPAMQKYFPWEIIAMGSSVNFLEILNKIKIWPY